MMNNSGLEALGRAVLVQMYEPTKKKGSLIEIPQNVQERSSQLEQKAIVVQVGAAAWEDESKPRAAPGDHVFVTKFAGFPVRGPKDGELYRLVNDRDIFCKITHIEDEGAGINHGY